ncbi:MAG TPA: methyltransferase domain-containing protein [Casimicrobiaceae bacterium]
MEAISELGTAGADALFGGSIAQIYDRNLGPVLFEPYARDLARRLADHPAGPVLETACGTGILTRELRKRFPRSVRIVATDVSQSMLDYARTECNELEDVEWTFADAAALPFPSATFAAVACQFGLMFVGDKRAAFAEARRVLVQGGTLAFSVWDCIADNPVQRAVHQTVSSFFPQCAPEFFDVVHGFYDRHVIRCLLEAHGFDGRIETVTLEAHCPSAAAVAIGTVKGTPISAAIREAGIDIDRVVDAVTDALARLGGNRPFRSTMQAFVVVARARAG